MSLHFIKSILSHLTDNTPLMNKFIVVYETPCQDFDKLQVLKGCITSHKSRLESGAWAGHAFNTKHTMNCLNKRSDLNRLKFNKIVLVIFF